MLFGGYLAALGVLAVGTSLGCANSSRQEPADGSADVTSELIAIGPVTSGDGSADADEDARDAGSLPALPVVPNVGGPVIASPKLVTVTFSGFAYESQVESFGAFVVGSNWITTVGADYGVGTGTHTHITLTSDMPPATAADADIQAVLRTRLADGTLPGGAHRSDSGYIYMVFYPPSTQLGTSKCVSDSTGSYRNQDWHLAEDDTNGRFAYVAMGTCAQQSMAHLGLQASHELIEAATDPYPKTAPAWRLPSTSPWWALGAEIGDLCELGAHDTIVESGFTFQRIWSNSAARAGRVPCIPDPSGEPYLAVLGVPDVDHPITAGGTLDVQVTGWASMPSPDWSVSVDRQSSISLTVQPSTFQTNAGTATMLTLAVAPGTPSGTRDVAILLSSTVDSAGKLSAVSGWPVVVDVQ